MKLDLKLHFLIESRISHQDVRKQERTFSGFSEKLSERGIQGEEEKIPPVPPGYRGMKDEEMEE